MAITRTAWVDDDGTGTTGTVLNNAAKTSLYGEIDSALALLLPKAGGTLTGDLLFTDATYDIGKSGATRPRDGWFSRKVTSGGGAGVDGDIVVDALNPSAGASARAFVNLTAGTVANQLIGYGTGNTGGISGIGGEFAVYTAGNGGLSLLANHASGVFRVTTGGTTVRFSISETGAVAIVGTTVTIGGRALTFGANDSGGAGYRTVTIVNA